MKTVFSLISHNPQTTAASILSGVAFFVGGAFYFYLGKFFPARRMLGVMY